MYFREWHNLQFQPRDSAGSSQMLALHGSHLKVVGPSEELSNSVAQTTSTLKAQVQNSDTPIQRHSILVQKILKMQ